MSAVGVWSVPVVEKFTDGYSVCGLQDDVIVGWESTYECVLPGRYIGRYIERAWVTDVGWHGDDRDYAYDTAAECEFAVIDRNEGTYLWSDSWPLPCPMFDHPENVAQGLTACETAVREGYADDLGWQFSRLCDHVPNGPAMIVRIHDDGVVELDPASKLADVCGTCGRGWDDRTITGRTPVPSARCPFEYDHDYSEDDEPRTRVKGVPGEWYQSPIWRDVASCGDDALDGYSVRYEGILADGNVLQNDATWYVWRSEVEDDGTEWFTVTLMDEWRIVDPEGNELTDLNGATYDDDGLAYASFDQALDAALSHTRSRPGFTGTPDELARGLVR